MLTWPLQSCPTCLSPIFPQTLSPLLSGILFRLLLPRQNHLTSNPPRSLLEFCTFHFLPSYFLLYTVVYLFTTWLPLISDYSHVTMLIEVENVCVCVLFIFMFSYNKKNNFTLICSASLYFYRVQIYY